MDTRECISGHSSGERLKNGDTKLGYSSCHRGETCGLNADKATAGMPSNQAVTTHQNELHPSTRQVIQGNKFLHCLRDQKNWSEAIPTNFRLFTLSNPLQDSTVLDQHIYELQHFLRAKLDCLSHLRQLLTIHSFAGVASSLARKCSGQTELVNFHNVIQSVHNSDI